MVAMAEPLPSQTAVIDCLPSETVVVDCEQVLDLAARLSCTSSRLGAAEVANPELQKTSSPKAVLLDCRIQPRSPGEVTMPQARPPPPHATPSGKIAAFYAQAQGAARAARNSEDHTFDRRAVSLHDLHGAPRCQPPRLNRATSATLLHDISEDISDSAQVPAWDVVLLRSRSPSPAPQRLDLPSRSPSPPVNLPALESTLKQKVEYMKVVDDREEYSLKALEEQRQIHVDGIHEQADHQREQLLMQIEHQVKHLETKLARDYQQLLAETKQQFSKLRNSLEQQATQLTAEFQHKQMHNADMQQQPQVPQLVYNAVYQQKIESELEHMARTLSLQVQLAGASAGAELEYSFQTPLCGQSAAPTCTQSAQKDSHAPRPVHDPCFTERLSCASSAPAQADRCMPFPGLLGQTNAELPAPLPAWGASHDQAQAASYLLPAELPARVHAERLHTERMLRARAHSSEPTAALPGRAPAPRSRGRTPPPVHGASSRNSHALAHLD